jgi:hypothetical protein
MAAAKIRIHSQSHPDRRARSFSATSPSRFRSPWGSCKAGTRGRHQVVAMLSPTVMAQSSGPASGAGMLSRW